MCPSAPGAAGYGYQGEEKRKNLCSTQTQKEDETAPKSF